MPDAVTLLALSLLALIVFLLGIAGSERRNPEADDE